MFVRYDQPCRLYVSASHPTSPTTTCPGETPYSTVPISFAGIPANIVTILLPQPYHERSEIFSYGRWIDVILSCHLLQRSHQGTLAPNLSMSLFARNNNYCRYHIWVIMLYAMMISSFSTLLLLIKTMN